MTSTQTQTQSNAASPPAEELRNVQYVLAELARWEAEGIVSREQANTLREAYTRRVSELQEQLSALKSLLDASRKQPEIETPKRPLLEAVSDAGTLRLLLYTGAAMLVVGVVIWLRDALYLKLQEPIVQAALLAFGTCAAMFAGWYATLRTRQRLTGRALTLIGSLLVPVNFWFLVRSGLISRSGRAWMVCALCTGLYAATARLQREKLYVYLSSIALVATVWAIILRVEREAFGLYALSLMLVSLLLLHLSRQFPQTNDTADEKLLPSGWSRELWSTPLAHVALAGALFSAICYMPLRLWWSPFMDSGFFRLRTSDYDPAVAMLLFACAGYTAWFAGRFIYTKRRVLFYCLSALLLCWTEFLMFDALRVSHLTTLLALSLTALGLIVAAHTMRNEALAKAFYPASLLVAVLLALASCLVALIADSARTWTHGATLFVLATVFTIASAARFSKSVARSILACAAMSMLAVLFALHASAEWFAVIFASALFSPLLLLSRYTLAEGNDGGNVWLERFSFDAACATLSIAFVAALIEATAHLQTGNRGPLSSCIATSEISLLSFAAYALLKEETRVWYFRAALAAAVSSYALWCLRAGYSPFGDMEIYTTPVAVLLLVIAYLFLRAEQPIALKKARDAKALLWTGSILLCAPLCLRAFDARLVEGVPALSRDLALLCASLALIFFGATNRLRAPVMAGGAALLAELSVLTLTSVDWAQVPLKIYLVTMGALIVFVCWCLEFRREQLLLVRKRISESRAMARERFGEWR